MIPKALLIFLIFLILLVIPTTPTTTFFFRGNIFCNHTGPYNYQIHVVEEDITSPNDEISRASFVRATSSPSPFNISAFDTPDVLWNKYLEIAFNIYHDCNYNRRHLKGRVYIGEFLAYPGSHYIDDINIDITDKGDLDGW